MLNIIKFIYFQITDPIEFLYHTKGRQLVTSFAEEKIPDALHYLSKHRYSPLQDQVKNSLRNMSIERIKEILISATQMTFEQGSSGICKDIVPLSILQKIAEEPAIETAARHLIFHGTLEDQKKGIDKLLDQPALLLCRIQRAVDSVISGLLRGYQIDLDSPVREAYRAQQQLMFFRTLAKDILRLGSYAYLWIKSGASSESLVKRAMDLAAGVPKLSPYITESHRAKAVRITRLAAPVLSVLGIALLYSIAKNRNKLVPNKLPFFNFSLNEQVKRGEIKEPIPNPSIDTVIKILDMEKKAACLVGPPGVGKTQLVQSLAYMIEKKQIPSLDGKFLFSGNMGEIMHAASFDHEGGGVHRSGLSVVSSMVEGVEENVIIFLDEFAACFKSDASKGQASSGSIVDNLKTQLTGKIKYIVATTQQEYDEFIGSEKALVDRLECVIMTEPDDDSLEEILQDRIQNFKDNKIEVTPEGIRRIIELSKKLPGYNPRKVITLLDNALSNAANYKPRKIELSMNKAKRDIKSLERRGRVQNVRSLEARDYETNINKQQKILKELSCNKIEQDRDFKFIHTLTKSVCSSEKKIRELAKQIINNPQNKNLEKEYLQLDLITLPFLKQLRTTKIVEFNTAYDEIMPDSINAKTIDSWSADLIDKHIQAELQDFFKKQFYVSSSPRPDGLNMTLENVTSLVAKFLDKWPINGLNRVNVSAGEVAEFLSNQLVELKVVANAQDSRLPDLEILGHKLVEHLRL